MDEEIDIDESLFGEDERLAAIITNQLEVLASIDYIDPSLYDEAQEHKIRIVTRASQIIMKCQAKMIKEI